MLVIDMSVVEDEEEEVLRCLVKSAIKCWRVELRGFLEVFGGWWWWWL
jgi:hypothetical protein